MGAWLTLIGLALAGIGIGSSIAVVGRWIPIRALANAGSLALVVPGALVGIGLVAFIVGLVVYVFAPTRTRESATAGHASLRTVLASLAVAAIPANLVTLAYLYATGQAGETGAPSPVVLLVSIIPLELSVFLVLYLRIIRPGVLTWREIGLSTQRLGTRIATGFGGYVLILVAIGGINYLLQSLGVRQTQAETYQGVRSASAPEFLAILFAGGVLAPIAEESFFRGYVFTAFRRRRGRVVAYLLSAGLFAVLHFNLPALPAIFVVGLGFALLYDLTNSLIPGIVAHGLNNSVAFVILYFASASLPPS